MGRKSTKIILSDESSDSECTSVKVKRSSTTATAKTAYDRLNERWQEEPCYKLSMNKRDPECINAYQLSIRNEGNLLDWLKSSEYEDHDRKLHPLRVIYSDDTVPPTLLEPFRAIITSSFESTDSNKDIIDLYVNACGPVWASAICPTNRASGQTTAAAGVADRETYRIDKYIAVGVSGIGHPTSTSHGADVIRTLGEVEKGGNLLQIWRVYGEYRPPVRTAATSLSMNPSRRKKGSDDPNFVPKTIGRPRKYPKLEEDENKTPKKRRGKKATETAMEVEESPATTTAANADVSATVTPGSNVHAELVYCVSLKDRGPTWAVEWSPAPLAASGSGSVLGLLAVVSGDGGCMVLQLPESVPPSSHTHSSTQHASGYLASIPVIPEEAVRVYEVRIPGQVVTSVAWSPSQAGQFSCGMVDGSVTVWSLDAFRGGSTATATTTVVSTPVMHLVDTLQHESKLACMAAVRSLSYCPYDASLLLVVGQDDVKIWSLKDYLRPVFSKKMNAPTVSSCWDACGYGFYMGDCETTGFVWNPLWGNSFKGLHRKELFQHSLQYGAVWGAAAVVCDGQSFVLSAGADGTVRGGFTSVMASMKNKNTAALECFRLDSVTAAPDPATTASTTSSSSGNNGVQCGAVLEGRVCGHSKSVAHLSTEERFSECPGTAVQSIAAISLAHSTTAVTGEDIQVEGTSSARKQQQRGCSQSAVHAVPLAPLVLTAYGTATGLLRMHTIDALRCLFDNPVSS